MSLNYDHDDNHLKALETVLDDYTEWFLQVTRRLFYPAHDHSSGLRPLERPRSFDLWAAGESGESAVKPALMDGIRNLYRDLTEKAETQMFDAARSKTSPAYGQYHKLAVLFEEFIGHLRRLEKDMLLEDSGIDSLTGLRSKDVMEKDIRREMDRLARQGKPFAIALVRVDDFENKTPAERDDSTVRIAEMIKKSMRSFDDAYRVEDGTFVLSLKQTGSAGGIRALKRLRGEIDKSGATHKVDGQEMPLSFSSCIGEPSDADDIILFLENLKKDLTSYRGDGGSLLEYMDLSPLQRYVREKDRERG